VNDDGVCHHVDEDHHLLNGLSLGQTGPPVSLMGQLLKARLASDGHDLVGLLLDRLLIEGLPKTFDVVLFPATKLIKMDLLHILVELECFIHLVKKVLVIHLAPHGWSSTLGTADIAESAFELRTLALLHESYSGAVMAKGVLTRILVHGLRHDLGVVVVRRLNLHGLLPSIAS
jgi:hypothetical protein